MPLECVLPRFYGGVLVFVRLFNHLFVLGGLVFKWTMLAQLERESQFESVTGCELRLI